MDPATGELLGAGDHDHGDQAGGELSTRCLLQWCLGISKVTSLGIITLNTDKNTKKKKKYFHYKITFMKDHC